MTKEEIDVMWQLALRESVRNGEEFTRYRFSEMVTSKEREACAELCEHFGGMNDGYSCASAIRARNYQ